MSSQNPKYDEEAGIFSEDSKLLSKVGGEYVQLFWRNGGG